jgi:hypothetical protein
MAHKRAHSRHDAQVICDAVKSVKFDASCHRDIPDRTIPRASVRSWSRCGLHRRILFGHAVQIQGENYLLPTTIATRNSADLEDEDSALPTCYAHSRKLEAPRILSLLLLARVAHFAKAGVTVTAQGGVATVDPGTMLVYATVPGLGVGGRNWPQQSLCKTSGVVSPEARIET